jgi:peptidoglycan/xylan/chitin deacetylase (PgdA/CDA1 family)
VPEFAKAIAEAILGSRLAFRTGSYFSEPRGLVLSFHNVLSERVEPRGDRSLHVPVSTFCEIVDWLAEAFEVVPLDQVLNTDPVAGGRPRAAITFDDAYQGAIAVAIPELIVRRLPATVFAISGAVEGQTFWWDALADGYAGGMPAEIRETALCVARGREAEVLDWAIRNGHPIAELDGEFVAAPWSAIEGAAGFPGIAIASHTRSHPNLATLPIEELMEELAGSRHEIQARIPACRPWLAYPYGHSSPAVESAAAKAGYEMAFRVSGGVVLAGDDSPEMYSLPRLNIPAGLSLRGFRIRAAGMLGR